MRDSRPAIGAAPGRVERYDYECERNSTRNLVDEAYPDVGKIRIVLDNLNIHKLGSLYETFDPSEARRIAKRLEFHHTPKYGSWLNPVLSQPKGWRR